MCLIYHIKGTFSSILICIFSLHMWTKYGNSLPTVLVCFTVLCKWKIAKAISSSCGFSVIALFEKSPGVCVWGRLFFFFFFPSSLYQMRICFLIQTFYPQIQLVEIYFRSCFSVPSEVIIQCWSKCFCFWTNTLSPVLFQKQENSSPWKYSG